eukprot:300544_1
MTDVVLNSFALTFVIELDDIVNLFESDEDKLIDADWSNLERSIGDYDDKMGKRKIVIFTAIGWGFMMLIILILSPFVFVGTVVSGMYWTYDYIKVRHTNIFKRA